MTDSPATPRAHRYQLRTFTTVLLVGPDGETVLGKHGHHHRRLALLAVLAAAGERGRSRDQLLLLFWPDATQSRARHSLDQLLYALRASIGESSFASTNPVRLNTDVIASDVAAFNMAFERGDLEAAVDVYGGPFLDGFHLDDAPEFERWLEGERARLAAIYADALEGLARDAEAIQDHASAVRWWRRLTEVDPVSSKNAAGLIRALMSAGDHPSALQYAERYEALIAEELGTSAGPAVASLVAEARARAESRPEPMPVSRSAASSPPMAPDVPARLTFGAEASPVRARGRSMAYALGAAMIIALFTTMAWLRTTRETTPSIAGPQSIAVLSFEVPSDDPEDVTIADGLSEDLVAALWRIPDLRVIARGSVLGFRNSDVDARRIGDSLGVTNLLEGSVTRSGPRLRVQVRLVNALDGSTRWVETFDRERQDVFEVQSDVAASVARALHLQLTPAAVQKLRLGPTQNIAAYELYLRGRDPVRLRSPTDSGPRHGLALLRQAVALDSNFAAAYAAMPYMYFGLASRAANLGQMRAARRLADSSARKALALDPSLPEAHLGLGVALVIGLPDLRGSEAALRRAIALGGAPRAREHLSRVLMWSGRHAAALVEARRAAAEDPMSASAAADVGEALCANGQSDAGLAQLKQVGNVQPPLLRVHGYRGLCYAMKDMWPQAVQEFRQATRLSADPSSPMLGFALARSGEVAEARRMQADAIDAWRQTGRGAYRVAYIAAGLGDNDLAFDWLDKAGDDLLGATSLMYPLFKELQADPRFGQYRERLGLDRQ